MAHISLGLLERYGCRIQMFVLAYCNVVSRSQFLLLIRSPIYQEGSEELIKYIRRKGGMQQSRRVNEPLGGENHQQGWSSVGSVG